MIKGFIIVFVGALLMASCSTDQKSGSEGQTDLGIHLKDGEKWPVNAEMKPHIEKGKAVLAKYVSEGDRNYKGLGESLTSQNKALIKSCTMKGEAHDELHKWLHPHMELVEELTNAKNTEEAAKVVAQLEGSFDTYDAYFK